METQAKPPNATRFTQNHQASGRLLTVALIASLHAIAQQPEFTLRAIVEPGTTIAGHTFTPETTIDAVAFSDAGQAAFLARWKSGDEKRAAVFTTDRIVAKEGDTIDGQYIGAIRSSIAINAPGQVAFGAICSASKLDSDATIGRPCIVIQKHVAPLGYFDPAAPMVLTDDGLLVLGTAPARLVDTPPAESKKPGLFGRVHIKPPKDLPISIAPKSNKRQPQSGPPLGGRPPLEIFIHPFSVRITNARGQVLVPVNLTPSGFLILIATPVKH